jgi:hypothetical protein
MSYLSFLDSELRCIQDKYRVRVERGFEVLRLNYFTLNKCLWFVDEIAGFWLEHREILRYVWDRLTDRKECFILSAALNLKTEGTTNHYEYKAVGDFQLLHDPFLRLEGLLRAPSGSINHDELEAKFNYIIKDTLSILNNYPYDFFFVDASLLSPTSQEEKVETIRKGYDNFLKELFNHDEPDSLAEIYPTYEKIEERISLETCQLLQFNGADDLDIPLGDRVEKFLNAQAILSNEATSGSQCERFMLALWCVYAQALDPILTCLSAGLYPYYRWDVPAKYFYLLMQGYKKDKNFVNFIGKTNAAYFLSNGISQLNLDGVHFDEYRKYIKKERPYHKLCKMLQPGGEKFMQNNPSDISKAVRPIIEKIKSDLGV